MDILFSKLKVGCDYSFIKNKGGIVPHVDGQGKYSSLMLYFPKKISLIKTMGLHFGIVTKKTIQMNIWKT
jgi:hypothetical protein